MGEPSIVVEEWQKGKWGKARHFTVLNPKCSNLRCSATPTQTMRRPRQGVCRDRILAQRRGGAEEARAHARAKTRRSYGICSELLCDLAPLRDQLASRVSAQSFPDARMIARFALRNQCTIDSSGVVPVSLMRYGHCSLLSAPPPALPLRLATWIQCSVGARSRRARGTWCSRAR